MTPVGDYLKKLLYQYDCLVVPELGAFLTHYVPASFTEVSGQYLPPRKQLAFNEALRLDDGILINYIMLHESVNRDGALRYIGQFSAEVRQQIRTSGSYRLEGIGLLMTNEEGKLQFHPELRHNFYGESFGLQPILAQHHETAGVSLPVTVLPVSVSQSLAVPDADDEGGKLMPMPVLVKRPVWHWAAATLLVGSLAALSYVSVVQPNQFLQSDLNPASLLRSPNFLPVPVAAAPPVRPTDSDKLMAGPVQPVSVAVTPKADPNGLAVSTVPVGKETPAPVVAPLRLAPAVPVGVAKKPGSKTVTAVPKRVRAIVVKPFLVVAGSFSSRRNALGLRRQLVKAGFDEAYLMMPARRRELIKVAAFGASTLAEADTVMVKVSELTGVPAWLMRTRH